MRPPLWPHQDRAIAETTAAITAGERALCLTSPTGGGKSRCMEELIWWNKERDGKTILFTNRRLLLEQLMAVLQQAGIFFGVRAAGFRPDDSCEVQLSSIQTEYSRVHQSKIWKQYPASLVLVDEAHSETEERATTILDGYRAAGAAVVGFTATPVNLAHLYTRLIVAGTNSELRRCGAHVPCFTYGPDEPDARRLPARVKVGEDLSENQIRKAIMAPNIFARVLEWYEKLNPDNRPTILFAPGVKESLWFAEQFRAAGISAAHIDGDEISYGGLDQDGESVTEKSTRERRAEILDGSRSGRIKVLCNRFVLREGIDLPHIGHAIFATIFGSLSSYLQAGGRLLRSYPGLECVTVQDHGGCLDSQTEILTARGWRGRGDIRNDDLVAAFDRNSSEISWQPILHRHDRPLEPGEKMFSASGRQVDIRVTGNHKIVHKFRTTSRDNVAAWPDHFTLARADEIADSKVRFKIPICGWQSCPGINLTDDEIRFIGWFVTDGTRSKTSISITQADHQPQIADLEQCLIGCGFDYTVTHRRPFYFRSGPQTVFHIPKGTCAARPRNGWVRLAGFLDKDLALGLDEMDARQFSIFLHAVHLGDGDKRRRGGAYRISTGNKKFADRLQGLAIRRGFKCNISCYQSRKSPLYILNIQPHATTIVHGEHAAIGQTCLVECPTEPGERVWCVANPLETLVVRRNGKVSIIGNSWHRHGSLNADRIWNLTWAPHVYSGVREQQMREKKAPEPIRCPKCSAIRSTGADCQKCGYRMTKKSRPVVQTDGTLKEMVGDIYRPRRVMQRHDTQREWEKIYHRARSQKWDATFAQAEALFFYENHYWPPRTLPLMPIADSDWYLKVRDVPRDGLRQVEQSRQAQRSF